MVGISCKNIIPNIRATTGLYELIGDMCSSEGSFAGVYQWDEKRNRYFPVKMF